MKKIKKKQIKNDYITTAVLYIFALFLLVLFLNLKSNYFKLKNYAYDYFYFKTSNYEEKNEEFNTVVRQDGICEIKVLSNFENQNKLSNFGDIQKINNQDWVKQEFDNGETWLTNYKNEFYIVQMYSNDSNSYIKCQKDFEKIKKTFSFLGYE